MGVAGLYALPALMGFGEHWYLSTSEEKEIGRQGAAFLRSFPELKAKRAVELISRWGPGIGFAAGVAVLAGTRIAQTLEERRGHSHAGPEVVGGIGRRGRAAGRAAPGDRGADAPAARTAESAGPVGPSITELFAQDE